MNPLGKCQFHGNALMGVNQMNFGQRMTVKMSREIKEVINKIFEFKENSSK